MNQPGYGYDDFGHGGGYAGDASVGARASFLVNTYLHLMGAVFAAAGFMALLFMLPAETQRGLVGSMVTGYNWAIILVLYMGVSYVAQKWAMSDVSVGVQYAGLGMYTVAVSLITYPLVWFALNAGPPGVLPMALVATLVLFAGLSGIVYLTREDFSFLGGAVRMGMLIAMVLIFASIFFGFHLGIIFTVAMIGLMSLCILYDTSNVLHHYRTTQHVAASLALFASLATLFFYVLRLVMELSAAGD